MALYVTVTSGAVLRDGAEWQLCHDDGTVYPGKDAHAAEEDGGMYSTFEMMPGIYNLNLCNA